MTEDLSRPQIQFDPRNSRVGALAEMYCPKNGRLRLPVIQRGLVWRNEQILNYWDSLLRGFPPGTLLVHLIDQSGVGIWELLDGQQRVETIRLGCDKGRLTETRRLWVNLSSKPDRKRERWFDLRINSSGRPFGYRPEAPNERPRTEDVKHGLQAAGIKPDDYDPRQLFNESRCRSSTLMVDDTHVISLPKLLQLARVGGNKAIESLKETGAGFDEDAAKEFLDAAKNALEARFLVQEIASDLLTGNNQYSRYFQRVGQGGTRLSDDDLSYSLIKMEVPDAELRAESICHETQNMVSPMQVALGAFRVARLDGPREHARFSRPTPGDVFAAHTEPAIWNPFEELFSGTDSALGASYEAMRRLLETESASDGGSLPTVLIADLPRDLVDVLLLFLSQEQRRLDGRCLVEAMMKERANLVAFSLYWLVFVALRDEVKAARQSFKEVAGKPGWELSRESLRALIAVLESDGCAYIAPQRHELEELKQRVEESEGCGTLRVWKERFLLPNGERIDAVADTMRLLAINRKASGRILKFVQRRYLSEAFKNFDPNSVHDDDLPYDFDHLVPNSMFGASWTESFFEAPLGWNDETFRRHRRELGNTLGNFRWLSAAANRERQDGPLRHYTSKFCVRDRVCESDVAKWDEVIGAKGRPWTIQRVAEFQKLIDLRTIELTRVYMEEGGIFSLLS